MSNFNFKWNGAAVKVEVEGICEKAVNDGAKMVAKDARRLAPVRTGGLKKSIRIQKWKKPGIVGAYVVAGEKNREHIARFVELGTPGETYKSGKKKGRSRTPIKAKPFLRPALKKNKSKIRNAFRNKLK